jgi:hypothetical protein
MNQNQMFATDIAPSGSHQITSFKMLTYTVFHVLFSYVHGFGQINYLSLIGFGNKHNLSNIFTIAKYGNFSHNALRSGMHLVYVYNFLEVIWLTFEQKQSVWILFTATSTTGIFIYRF